MFESKAEPYLFSSNSRYLSKCTELFSLDGVGWNHSVIMKKEYKKHWNKKKFRSNRVLRGSKNKQKACFITNHETIIFQEMLDVPPQQEAQNGT